MEHNDAIRALRGFLGWFEDNFESETYIMEEDQPDGTIREKWISYLDHPDYLEACRALDALEAS